MPNFTGTESGETLDGTSTDDVITGLGGADTLNGDDGHDVLYGDFAEPEGIVLVSVNSDGDQATGVSGASYVSPDGQTILFWSQADNLDGDVATGYGLFAWDRATGDVTRVAINTTTPTELAFSPDGQMVTYRAGGTHPYYQYAYVLDLESEAVTLISVGPNGEPASGIYSNPKFSSDGEYILALTGDLYDWYDGNPDFRPSFIVQWELTGSPPVDYTELEWASEDALRGDVSFSSDGTLAVVLGQSGENPSIRLFDTATGALLALVSEAEDYEGEVLRAVFSPDDSVVAWADFSGVYVYDIATGLSRTLVASPPDQNYYNTVQFALDGTALVVAADIPGADEIWLIDIASGEIAVLARGRNAQVSADGTYITFSSTATDLVDGDTNGREDVFLLPLTGADGDSDTLNGGAGNDTLDGGAGADVMTGGTGNDSFHVDNAGDQTIEAAGGGIDTIYSSIDYVLTSANIEVVELTGTASINATGGSGDDTLIGNDGANILEGAAGSDVLRGGRGDDTYVIRDVNDQVVEVTGEGTDTVQSWINFAFDQGQSVENLTLMGTGNLTARGNSLANILRGNSGDNTLDGWTGADRLYGGAGDDTYIVDSSDQIIELADEGVDTVRSTGGAITLSDNVENLILLWGSAGYGNALANTLTGNGNANILDGKAGADTMVGGTGDDLYYVDNVGDVIVERAGEGVDTVRSSVSYTLSAYIQNLTLTGLAALNGNGNGGANAITGNTAANTLDGRGGDDTLFGGSGDDTLFGDAGNDILDGSRGVDAMAGGAGDDTYYVDDIRDVVTEAKPDGVDLVYASVGYTLQPGVYVENLTLTGSANINGTGNGLSNIITGNTGANILDGGSGGSDKFYGGLGDDVYYVNSSGDQVFELKGQGEDTIYSSISYTLAVGSYVETLVLTGTANLNGTGNGAGNILRGNSGNNVLDGGSGGSDKMYGGAGNDTYYVNSSGDKAYEAKSQGTDRVYSSVDYSLKGEYIEYLTLTGSANVYAKGNTLDNRLVGNSGDNRINGMEGQDRLTGGGGSDTFIWDATSHSKVNDSDRIVDLTNEDFIDLSRIDADINTDGTQQFVLVDAFTNTAGQVTLSFDGTWTNLNADTNGDGISDMLVRIDGDHTDFDNFIFGG